MLNNKTLFTPTMAKVLEDQGYLKEAAQIYSHLLDEMPGHKAFRDKLNEIQSRLAEAEAGEDKLPALFEEWITLALGYQQLKRLEALKRRIASGAGDG